MESSRIKNKRILYLYTGDHPVHHKFAETIGADIRERSWKIPRGYDIYLSEGSFIIPTILKSIGWLRKKKVINLFADPRLYYLDKGIYFDPVKNNIKKYPYIRKKINLFLLGKLDGALCVGPLSYDLLGHLKEKIPKRKVYSFVSNQRKDLLISVKPALNSQEILFIGSGPDVYYKGLDLLNKVVANLKKSLPRLKVRVIGNWDQLPRENFKDIIFEGKQKNIVPFIKKSSLMVHLGRGDTFPVSTIEAMISGIPVIVSTDTGTKEINR